MPSEAEYAEQARFDDVRYARDTLRAERDELRAENERLTEGLENWRKGAMTDAQRLIEAEAENERLRAVVDAARQLRVARIAMMTYEWNAHEQEAQATQALMEALIALDGS